MRRSTGGNDAGRRLRAAGRGAAALLALCASWLAAAPAMAGGLPYPLPSGSHYVFTTPNPPQTNTFVTTSDFWSVVGILPPAGADYDLAVSDPAGNPVGDSAHGAAGVDFVAVNSNYEYSSPGTYRARTSVVSGGGSYGMEFSNPMRVVSSAEPNVAQTISMGPGEFITTSDVWLNGGQVYTFDFGYFTGSVNCPVPGCYGVSYLMPSDRLAASESQALWRCGTAIYGCGYENWTAPRSGWYSLITIMVGRPYNVNPTVTIRGAV